MFELRTSIYSRGFTWSGGRGSNSSSCKGLGLFRWTRGEVGDWEIKVNVSLWFSLAAYVVIVSYKCVLIFTLPSGASRDS